MVAVAACVATAGKPACGGVAGGKVGGWRLIWVESRHLNGSMLIVRVESIAKLFGVPQPQHRDHDPILPGSVVNHEIVARSRFLHPEMPRIRWKCDFRHACFMIAIGHRLSNAPNAICNARSHGRRPSRSRQAHPVYPQGATA